MVRDPEAHRSGHPPLALIAAKARNGVIGADNRLPWRLPEDLRHFRALTLGHAVIMGRRTWESLRGALPGRQNIVVTRRADYVVDNVDTARSLEEALSRVDRPAPAFCIGGGQLYRAALPRAGVVYLTEIDHDFEGDTVFPALDRAIWREASREHHARATAEGYDYAFVTYVRRDAAEAA